MRRRRQVHHSPFKLDAGKYHLCDHNPHDSCHIQPFFDAYAKDRAQYLKDNEEWKTGTSHKGYRQYRKAIRRRREVYGLKDESGNLLKAPPSAYALFTAEKYKEARDRGEVGKIVEIAATWKGLSEAGKQVRI